MDDNTTPPQPAPPAAAAAAAPSSRTISEHLALTLQTIDQLTTIFSFPPHIARDAVEAIGPEDVTKCYNWILDNYNDLEDCGGPVVPKLDCPHLEQLLLLEGGNDQFQSLQHVLNNTQSNNNNKNGSSSGNDDCCTKVGTTNLFQLTCQHYSSLMRRPTSRKRLRSEDDGKIDEGQQQQKQQQQQPTGQLKRDEDYDDENDAMNESTTASSTTTAAASSCCNGKENWMCLHCGLLLCSRYEHGHAKLHWEDTKSAQLEDHTTNIHNMTSSVLDTKSSNNDHVMETTTTTASSSGEKNEATGHCIAISLADLSVWCYECNAYLHHDSLVGLMKRLEVLKFGSSSGGEKDDEKEEEVMESENIEKEEGGSMSISNSNEKEDNNMDLGEATKPAALENDINEKQSSGLGINKRKSQPKKLVVGQGGTALLSSPNRGQGGASQDDQNDSSSENSIGSGEGSENDNNGDENSSSSSSNASGSSSDSSQQAAILAALLQGGQGEAIRAYLNRHESFNTSDMGQCVPMHMPAPPSFPNEMADFLRSPLCRSICVLAGAGMSVSSGIPDFRSAGVGLYDTIRPELLTATELEQAIIEDDPTIALDKGMFLRNPLPMLELKRDFILGTQAKKWKATLAHRFVELLHTKLGKLTRLYTQNIDGLELQTTIPKEKIVNVHGSMGAAACEMCEAEVDFDEFCDKISSNIKDITGRDENAPETSTPITCDACGNPTVKPTIVLFHGSMPQLFHRRVAEDLPECDLLIIIGTSLQVSPANSLVYRIPPTALRMVMNNEKVGRRLGILYGEDSVRDVFAHGHSDETCLDLCSAMGWLPDLAEIIDELPESSARLLRQRLEQREEE